MSTTKKALLAENTVRRFMKLANVNGLADRTITHLKEELEDFEAEAEEEVEMPLPGGGEEIEAAEVDIAGPPLEEEPPSDEGDGIEIIGEKFKDFLRENDVEIEVEGSGAVPDTGMPEIEAPVDDVDVEMADVALDDDDEEVALAEAHVKGNAKGWGVSGKLGNTVTGGYGKNDGMKGAKKSSTSTSYGHVNEDSGCDCGAADADTGEDDVNEPLVNEIAVRVAQRLMGRSQKR